MITLQEDVLGQFMMLMIIPTMLLWMLMALSMLQDFSQDTMQILIVTQLQIQNGVMIVNLWDTSVNWTLMEIGSGWINLMELRISEGQEIID